RARRLRVRPRSVRRAGRRRLGRGRDHLGGDAGAGPRPARRVPPRRRQGRGGRGAARRRKEKRALVGDPAERRRRSRPSGRLPGRRPGVARVGGDAQSGGVMIVAEDRSMSAAPDAHGSFLWGPLTPFALAVAVAAAVVDQAAKLWVLYAVDLPARGIVRLTPFLDL